MSLQDEESVIDFDLDFLHQICNNVTPENCKDKNEKCCLDVNIVNNKIVDTDSLVRKFNDIKEEIDQLQKAIYSSREECKKVCIDFQTAMEKRNELMTERQTLRDSNQQLLDKLSTAQNQIDALESHSHQLQILVKKKETELEGLKVENRLVKCDTKVYEMKISKLQNEIDILSKINKMEDLLKSGEQRRARRPRPPGGVPPPVPTSCSTGAATDPTPSTSRQQDNSDDPTPSTSRQHDQHDNSDDPTPSTSTTM